MAAAAKRPSDHQVKAKPFTFMHEGVRHVLPPASDAMGKVPSRAFRDAVVDGGQAEIKLGFLCLEACGAKPEAVDALYDKTVVDLNRILGSWMTAKQPDGAATIPES